MPALVTLSLEDNLLVDRSLWFPANALNRLEELRLGRNRMRELSRDVISGLRNLRRLYLRSNGIETLPQGLFRATPRLDVVDLSANNISRLDRHAFNGKCLRQFCFCYTLFTGREIYSLLCRSHVLAIAMVGVSVSVTS